jgi:hypothetical protein
VEERQPAGYPNLVSGSIISLREFAAVGMALWVKIKNGTFERSTHKSSGGGLRRAGLLVVARRRILGAPKTHD